MTRALTACLGTSPAAARAASPCPPATLPTGPIVRRASTRPAADTNATVTDARLRRCRPASPTRRYRSGGAAGRSPARRSRIRWRSRAVPPRSAGEQLPAAHQRPPPGGAREAVGAVPHHGGQAAGHLPPGNGDAVPASRRRRARLRARIQQQVAARPGSRALRRGGRPGAGCLCRGGRPGPGCRAAAAVPAPAARAVARAEPAQAGPPAPTAASGTTAAPDTSTATEAATARPRSPAITATSQDGARDDTSAATSANCLIVQSTLAVRCGTAQRAQIAGRPAPPRGFGRP